MSRKRELHRLRAQLESLAPLVSTLTFFLLSVQASALRSGPSRMSFANGRSGFAGIILPVSHSAWGFLEQLGKLTGIELPKKGDLPMEEAEFRRIQAKFLSAVRSSTAPTARANDGNEQQDQGESEQQGSHR